MQKIETNVFISLIQTFYLTSSYFNIVYYDNDDVMFWHSCPCKLL